ncbi:MAG: cupin domain-containing protein [Pseudomonadota bacterium]
MSASYRSVDVAQFPHKIVRYDELVPCKNAFIDTRSPGSDQKENFTIIGPGVSENPDQFVHIAQPHGFNIGGARQPPGCLNSQHSHDTAEVFYVHSGTWRFMSGENADDGEVFLNPGDLISLPTNLFRGFENVGDESGFLFAILGGDDPGRVLWAPCVFDLATDYGLLLLENGSLVDLAAGQEKPTDVNPMPRTTSAQVAALDRATSSDLEKLVIRAGDEISPHVPAPNGVFARPLIGPEPLAWRHGFTITELRVAKGTTISAPPLSVPEVWFVQEGTCQLCVDGHSSRPLCHPGDTISLDPDSIRGLYAETDTTVLAVRGGDHLRDAKGACI